MPLTITTLKLSDDMIEHYDVLADRLGKPRSELMRSALQQVMDGNPVDPEELARFRARKAASKAQLSVGPGGKFIARAERPEIQAAYDLAQAIKRGEASLAADGPRYKKHGADEEEERERESNPASHPTDDSDSEDPDPARFTRRLSSHAHPRPVHRPSGVRPDRTTRRTLRAV